MYCRNCGRPVEDSKEICLECEASQNTTTFDPNQNVEVIKEVNSNTNYQEANTNQNTNYAQSSNTQNQQKSKMAAGLFGIFLGSFGVHNFYLGFTGKAVAQILITFLSCGLLAFVSAIWGLIEGILILSGSLDKDANGVVLKE
ncbi:MAG: TM2 domain-containing protein [Clostridia bacterium]